MHRRREMRVTCEQGESLAMCLQEAGVRHGDTVKTTIVGVGVCHPASHELRLAFCPAILADPRIAMHGSRAERRQQMPHDVTFSNGMTKCILAQAPYVGFIHIPAIVYSNGTIHLSLPQGRCRTLIRWETSPTLTGNCVRHAGAYRHFREENRVHAMG